MNDEALEAAGWECEEASYEELADLYAAMTTEARLERESEFERYRLDMAELPLWPTDAEIAEYEEEFKSRAA